MIDRSPSQKHASVAIGISLLIAGFVIASTTVNLNIILAVTCIYFGLYTLFAKERNNDKS